MVLPVIFHVEPSHHGTADVHGRQPVSRGVALPTAVAAEHLDGAAYPVRHREQIERRWQRLGILSLQMVRRAWKVQMMQMMQMMHRTQRVHRTQRMQKVRRAQACSTRVTQRKRKLDSCASRTSSKVLATGGAQSKHGIG